ncbi:IS3 family transposase [Leisingera sp. M527]|uniref:IS3 family transposase n=1 Tax=Leisingera sp. M527 TaxID=2867014 RepID=UPI0038FBF92A
MRKIWRQLQREGFTVARCTVARLMKSMGIQGARHCPRTNGGQKLAPGQAAQNHDARQKGPVPALAHAAHVLPGSGWTR